MPFDGLFEEPDEPFELLDSYLHRMWELHQRAEQESDFQLAEDDRKNLAGQLDHTVLTMGKLQQHLHRVFGSFPDVTDPADLISPEDFPGILAEGFQTVSDQKKLQLLFAPSSLAVAWVKITRSPTPYWIEWQQMSQLAQKHVRSMGSNSFLHLRIIVQRT